MASPAALSGEVPGGVVTYTRVRGGGCFDGAGGAANRIEIDPPQSLLDCAEKVHLNLQCGDFFEWDTSNNGGTVGNGWCGW